MLVRLVLLELLSSLQFCFTQLSCDSSFSNWLMVNLFSFFFFYLCVVQAMLYTDWSKSSCSMYNRIFMTLTLQCSMEKYRAGAREEDTQGAG